HPIAGPAVLATEPAQPTAERVASDPDVGGSTGHRAHPLPDRRLGDVFCEGSSLRTGLLSLDLDAAHPRGLDEDDPVERAERHRPMAGALPRHLQVVFTSEPNDLGDVVRALYQRHRGRLLVRGEIPGL